MMKKSVVQIDSFTRVSIVEWSESDINVLKLELNASAEWEEMEEKDLKSQMQVYGYLEECRQKAFIADEKAKEFAEGFKSLSEAE